MYRFLVKPKWLLLHLVCIAMVIIMINLGFWQLHRLHDRQAFNERVRQQSELVPIPLADALSPATGNPDTAALEYRPISVTGTYVAGHDYERSIIRGDVNGRDLIDALELADGTVLVVNRGWLPAEAPAPDLPSGEVTLTARLRVSATGGTGQNTDGTTQPVQIFRIDATAIAEQTGHGSQVMYVERITSDPAESDTLEAIPFPDLGEGPHLGYAVQWFLFSVCVLAGWAIAVAKKVGDLRDPERAAAKAHPAPEPGDPVF